MAAVLGRAVSLALVLSCLFLSCVLSQSVTPGDADPYCADRPTRQSTLPNEKILIDTQDYRSTRLLGPEGENVTWLTIDYDGGGSGRIPSNTAFLDTWFDANQSANCFHTIVLCAAGSSPAAFQSNWLITQYINISQPGVHRLKITVTFSANRGCTNQCSQQTFELWTYQTNEPDEVNRGNISYYSYAEVRLIHTASEGFTIDSEEIDVSSSGLYLAVLDQGSCTVINRIVVFYNVCPYRVSNKAIYPETLAPQRVTDDDREVAATCIENASPSSTDSLNLVCRFTGLWTRNASCVCNPGYEATNTSCQACPVGSYKHVQGNTDCDECPDNSNTTTNGSVSCRCISGYYRAPDESVTLECTAPPDPPLNLRNTSIATKSIAVAWTPPTDTGGRTDVSYFIKITLISSGASQNYSTQNTAFDFSNLIPFTTYLVQVTSMNGVSDQDPNSEEFRTISINLTTLPSPPSSPQLVSLQRSSDGGEFTILMWMEPRDPYGEVTGYRILVSEFNDTSTATVRASVGGNVYSYDLSQLDLGAGSYFVWVQAVTVHGESELSTAIQYLHTTSEASIIPVVAGSLVGIILFIVVAVAIVLVVVFLINNSKKKTTYSESYPRLPNSGYTNNEVDACHAEMELGTLPNPNRMYVDPRTYNSVNHAIEQNSVKEIPPKEIINLQEIGVGEFGLVYKGVWTLKDLPVAVKTLRGGASDEQRDNFLFEASVMGQFHHDNVVILYGVISRVDPVMIVMEYLPNGSLDRYLQKNLDKISNERLSTMAYGVAKGMSYLSGIGFVHRDLAARNILVANDGTCKVADFGLAREMVDNEYDVQKGGRIPVRWTAPEAISHRSFTTASDVWSYGVLLWEIFTFGETPYDGWDNASIFQRLENGERLKQPRGCPDDAYRIMAACWNAERSERPSFQNIVECFEVILFGKPKPKPKPAHLQSPNRPPPPTNSTAPNGDNAASISELLDSIGMTRYIELFHRKGYYKVADCFGLSEDDLQKIGVTLSGHQYKIVKNIHLKEEELGRVSPDDI